MVEKHFSYPLPVTTLLRVKGLKNLQEAPSFMQIAPSHTIHTGLSFTLRSFILKWQTWTDHENITNAELDWKLELEKRELITIKTALGDKLEKRTQLKYKKERIGAWTWVLPVLGCN